MSALQCHRRLEREAASLLADLRSYLMGRYVTLKCGKLYKGRKAKIDGIILSPEGEVLALAMVLRVDDQSTFLNDKPESRQYWLVNDLEWL